jgi:hypothetical protein
MKQCFPCFPLMESLELMGARGTGSELPWDIVQGSVTLTREPYRRR